MHLRLPHDPLNNLWLLAVEESSTHLTVLPAVLCVRAGRLCRVQIITACRPAAHPLDVGHQCISGISLVGSLVAAGAEFSPLSTVLGFIAVTAATINVVAGS